MAEYIERESLIKRFCERCNEEMSESPCEPSDCFAREVLKTIPAADVTPVIRCHECKHCDPENYHCDHPMGTAAPLRRKPDDFCSYGEKKEGAE